MNEILMSLSDTSCTSCTKYRFIYHREQSPSQCTFACGSKGFVEMSNLSRTHISHICNSSSFSISTAKPICEEYELYNFLSGLPTQLSKYNVSLIRKSSSNCYFFWVTSEIPLVLMDSCI